MNPLLWKAAVRTLRVGRSAAGALVVLAALAGVAQAGPPDSTTASGVPGVRLSSLISAMTLLIGGSLMIHDTARRQRLAWEALTEQETVDE